MPKISILGQIAEIDREIAVRQRVYPNQIREGKMRQAEAELLMERIHAIRDTLFFCKDNEADIRAYIAQKKAGAA